jgi:hypothetical protein
MLFLATFHQWVQNHQLPPTIVLQAQEDDVGEATFRLLNQLENRDISFELPSPDAQR